MAASASGRGDADLPLRAEGRAQNLVALRPDLSAPGAPGGGVVTRDPSRGRARGPAGGDQADARISRVIALGPRELRRGRGRGRGRRHVVRGRRGSRDANAGNERRFSRVRRGAPFVSEVEDIEYRLQSVLDARALRVVLARLSRGHRTAEDETAEVSADANVPGLDARTLRAGTLMRRVGGRALERGKWTVDHVFGALRPREADSAGEAAEF